jgi:enoyl-CoA hydratase/carnithine racemase
MSDVVKVERDGHVAVVSLNRPEKLNACSPAVFTGLRDAGLEVQADDEVRAVLLRGEGRAFCAGLDTASLQAFGSGGVPSDNGDRETVPAVDGFTIWHTMNKPVVAAVQGYALGAGFQLALAADIRFASPDAVMSVFEITYGLVPDLGGTQLLPRLVGPARAKELIWTALRFSGEQAEEWGIVNHVVPLASLEETARAFAHDLASRPPLPISFAKELVHASGRISLEEGHQRELMAQMKCLQSADMREAVAAAFEKREGSYTGT